MRFSVALLASVVGFAVGQGVTDKVSPTDTLAEGCKGDFEGNFEISIIDLGDKVKKDLIRQVRKFFFRSFFPPRQK